MSLARVCTLCGLLLPAGCRTPEQAAAPAQVQAVEAEYEEPVAPQSVPTMSARSADMVVATMPPLGDEAARREILLHAAMYRAAFESNVGDSTRHFVLEPVAAPPSVAIEEHDGTVCDAPVAITFTPDGKDLVVGQMGEMTVPEDSLLTFYNPADGKLKKSYKTGLSDIAGLAYSPKTGKLYATDFSWHDSSKGGLFELAIDSDEVKATKIIGLDKPTAIAFDKAGNLYLTEFGTAEKDSAKFPGTLSVIKAGL